MKLASSPHHPCTSLTHAIPYQHVVDGGMCGSRVHGHDDALARGQTVGLDDDGGPFCLDIGMGGLGVGKGAMVRGRDAVTDHEFLCEVLG